MTRFEQLSAFRLRPATALGVALFCVGGLLLFYSQTIAFTWDAGFHLIAAQLINEGKRPYLDFCFPQTPLNAYWTAFCMRILGHSWRVVQGMATLATVGAVVLASTYVFRRLPAAGWRVAAATATAVLFGLNELVFRFGTIAQAYGLCMLLMVAGFRVAVTTRFRPSAWRAAAAGALAGAAAGSSLLSAAAAPVLLAWIAIYSDKGNRWLKSAAFAAGAAVPFAPMARLFAEGPRQTWFNIFQYQAAFRHANWGSTVGHDLAQMSAWLDSTQAVLLILLAVAGWWLVRSSESDGPLRAELYLCTWMALGLGLELALAHPTFARYFVVGTPFLGILGGFGFYEFVSRLRGAHSRTWTAVALLSLLMILGAARIIYDNGEVYRWRDLQKVAAKIRQLEPATAVIYAEEPLYFLLNMDPPQGMQFAYSRELDLPPAESALYHIVPQKIMDQRLRDGKFDMAEICMDQDAVKRLQLNTLFRQTTEVEYCDLFWDPVTRK